MIDDFPYSAFDNIKEESGCYCWYIDWARIRPSDFEMDVKKRVNLVNAMFKLYAPNPIWVDGVKMLNKTKQSFGEMYEGKLESKLLRSNDSYCKLATDIFLFWSFLEFSKSLIIPLYIGKSKNLKLRIKQHTAYLFNPNADITYETSEKEILKNFSERFNNVAKECGNLGLKPHMLSVKLIYLKEENISEFESNLNYLYKPLFGIK
jgi:hypothetical protein